MYSTCTVHVHAPPSLNCQYNASQPRKPTDTTHSSMNALCQLSHNSDAYTISSAHFSETPPNSTPTMVPEDFSLKFSGQMWFRFTSLIISNFTSKECSDCRKTFLANMLINGKHAGSTFLEPCDQTHSGLRSKRWGIRYIIITCILFM
eukprot:gb/GECG01015432.1/.p1 GENE.gb/GECG01015432.1/~~gb/GECG01015432.1/.p1  ORF type:complete len:148 (+),score=3.42 gb/GECG01015432.1/:1-444(+)